ncbi:MAG: ComEC/Rec2 family competence protein [Sphingobacteriales bacterium]|nr:MAG: ComEC/Rec2 family competence protein [Sphingobacteriales bacterium]
MKTLEQHIPDSASLGLMQAMLLGDEVHFSDELRQLYADTGIIHIVAISGSHVAIFFVFTNALLFFIRRRRHQWVKYLLAIPLIWIYVMAAGAPSSAVRAAVMFSIAGMGVMLGRSQNAMNTLFATAFLMLCVQTGWLFHLGFQLSFIAVLSIILFYRPLLRLWSPANIVVRRLWQTACVSMAAELLIAPLVIYYFHLLPATFLVANIVAYLFMGMVLAAGVLLIICGKLPVLATAIGCCITWLVQIFNTVTQWLHKLNPPSFSYLHLTEVQLLWVYLIICSLSGYLILKKTSGLIVALSASCLMTLSLSLERMEILQQHKFVVYNLGHAGYAELISGAYHHAFLEDKYTGRSKKKDYAVKGMHVASHAWQRAAVYEHDLIRIGSKELLLLRSPLQLDSILPSQVDYLMLSYPLKSFQGVELQESFRYKKLIITGDQKRYRMQQWKDSCLKYNIPVHITSMDGAFILQ